jgi:hypothetical protein
MYYRNHWNRLRQVQTKCVANWYFHFPHGIPPYHQQSNTCNLTIVCSQWFHKKLYGKQILASSTSKIFLLFYVLLPRDSKDGWRRQWHDALPQPT